MNKLTIILVLLFCLALSAYAQNSGQGSKGSGRGGNRGGSRGAGRRNDTAPKGRNQWNRENIKCKNVCINNGNTVCEVLSTDNAIIKSFCCQQFGCEPLSENPQIKVKPSRNQTIDFARSTVCLEGRNATDAAEAERLGAVIYNRRKIHC